MCHITFGSDQMEWNRLQRFWFTGQREDKPRNWKFSTCVFIASGFVIMNITSGKRGGKSLGFSLFLIADNIVFSSAPHKVRTGKSGLVVRDSSVSSETWRTLCWLCVRSTLLTAALQRVDRWHGPRAEAFGNCVGCRQALMWSPCIRVLCVAWNYDS